MKALKILVVVMGLLIVVGVAVLVTLVVDRASGKSRGAPSVEAPTATALPLPANARIVETTSTDDRVVIRVAAPGEPDRLYLIDHHTGAVRLIVTLGGPSETKP